MTGLRVDHFHHVTLDESVTNIISLMRNQIMANFADLAAQLNAAADQAAKSKAEIVAAVGKLTQTVADLQAQIAAGADVPPEVIAAANRVSAATAELDALNPDA